MTPANNKHSWCDIDQNFANNDKCRLLHNFRYVIEQNPTYNDPNNALSRVFIIVKIFFQIAQDCPQYYVLKIQWEIGSQCLKLLKVIVIGGDSTKLRLYIYLCL